MASHDSGSLSRTTTDAMADGAASHPTGPSAPAVNKVARLLHLAAKAARTSLEQRLAAAGSSFATWGILMILREHGPMIQRELADYLSIEGPTLTRHLARLEAEGLITRSRSSADRRAATVELTPDGTETHQRLTQWVRAGYGEFLSGFSEDESQQLAGYLMRVVENADPEALRRARLETGPSSG